MWTKKYLTHKSMNLPFNSKVTGKRKKKNNKTTRRNKYTAKQKNWN